MTKIEAIVGPGRLEAVREALTHAWITGLTVTEVQGLPAGPAARYRGVDQGAGPAPLLRVEVVVPAPLVPRLLHGLGQALRGLPDDGLVSALPVVEAVRVRTGERGEDAL